MARQSSGPTFSFSSHQFSLETEHFLILVGWDESVVVPAVGGSSGSAFSFSSHRIYPRYQFSLETELPNVYAAE